MDSVTYQRRSKSSDWSPMQGFTAISSSEEGIRQGRLPVLLRARCCQYASGILDEAKLVDMHVMDAVRLPAGITTRLLRRFADRWLRRVS